MAHPEAGTLKLLNTRDSRGPLEVMSSDPAYGLALRFVWRAANGSHVAHRPMATAVRDSP